MAEIKYTGQIMFVTQLVRWRDSGRNKKKIYNRYVLKVPPAIAELLEPGKKYIVIIKEYQPEGEEVRIKDERR